MSDDRPCPTCITLLESTAQRLRKMASFGDDYDAGLREAAAFIEMAVIPQVRLLRRQEGLREAQGDDRR